MLVWLVSLSILPLLSLAIFVCGKSRETAHEKSDKSSKTAGVKKEDKSGKSSKSGRTKKSSEKSNKSKKASKTGKSSKKAKKSGKSGKSARSKSSKSKSAERTRSAKSSKVAVQKTNQPKVDASLKTQKSASLATQASINKNQQSLHTQPTQAAPVESKPIELRAEPQEMNYKATGGIQAVNIVNNTAERRVFKVKCSDNQLYRVHPVYQVIEGGQAGKVEVLRQNGASKTDKLVLLSVKTEGTAGEAKDLFSHGADQPQHMLAVPLFVDA